MEMRKCLFCGKMFKPKSHNQNICKDDHYWPCPDCGKPVKILESYGNFMKNSPNGRRCAECRGKAISKSRKNMTDEAKSHMIEKMQATSLLRYGTKWAASSDEVKQRRIEGTIAKYGVENLSQSSEIQDKIKSNCLQKYGVDHPAKCPEIRQHMVDGMIAKYGVSYAAQSDALRAKTIETVQKRYGVDNVGQSETVKDRMKQTCQDRYGVEYALQSTEIRSRIRETCKNKYGCAGVPNAKFIEKCNDPEFKLNYSEFVKDPRNYILSKFPEGTYIHTLSRHLNLDYTTVAEYVDKFELHDIVEHKYSEMESEVRDMILSVRPNTVIVMRDRKILDGLEIDIYLPEFNLGIECNPTCTHNSSLGFLADEPKSARYHAMKSENAAEKDVFLFHIFGYEWTNKRNIIESMILNLIGVNPIKVYARNCVIKEVPYEDAYNFLESNHRQGFANSSVRIGLYSENELVSLMTFSRPRKFMGKLEDSNTSDWELVRFCNMCGTSVVGGASKLFKYFTRTHPFDVIYSFSDIAHTRGTLYKKLGFTFIHRSTPNYVWVSIKDDSYYTRVKCQKHNLPKLFDDPSIDIANNTESHIMIEHGYVQVFDSGCIRWEYSNQYKA